MTPEQRAAALRLADALDQTLPIDKDGYLCGDAAALLRELASEQDDPMPGMSLMNRTIAYCAADTLRKLGYEWNGEAWLAAEPMSTYTITWDAQGRRLVNGKLAPEHATARCPEDGGQCGAGGYCRPEPQSKPVA